MKPRIIAFYLPQYHPIPENDEWWGKGFTEWTNVGKAKALFRGHYQPRVPADLGYYDLRLPQVRERQAELAREAGVEGFMYWHYWFGNGKRLMDGVFDEVVKSGRPDFPFCLGWANHSWYAKDWNANGSKNDKLLIEQTYPGEHDYRSHFEAILPALKDSRYIKVGDQPVFLIFDPSKLPPAFIPLWNSWAKENGFPHGLYFVANVKSYECRDKDEVLRIGFDAVTFERLREVYTAKSKFHEILNAAFNRIVLNRPIFTKDYRKACLRLTNREVDRCDKVIPTLLPNWDHTPRSGERGLLLTDSTPARFKEHANTVLDIVKHKQNKLIFLKSWNEWGEGNYMEPDLKFGKGYICALREALDEQPQQ